MSEELLIDKYKTDEEVYANLIPQLSGLLDPDEPVISNLSNVTAAIKQSFNKISWVGFYLIKDNILYLGPFQGNVACTSIEVGKGVCGSSVKNKSAICVDDVDKFPGHIACDSGSKSEIVVPLLASGKVIGVLDLDSYNYAAFNEIDQINLEEICTLICNEINIAEFEIR